MSIPDLLTPPTDNLYKFQAIAGLLLILVSVSYPPWLFHKAIVGYLAAENEKVQLQTQATFAQRRLDTLQRRLDTLLEDPDTLKSSMDALENRRKAERSDSEKVKVSIEIDRLRTRWQEAVRSREDLVDAAHELSLSLQLKTAQTQHQQTLSNTELWMSRIIVFCAIAGIMVGLILTFRGFQKWYRRVQVFQDAHLKKQSEDRVANVSDNTALP